MLSRRAFFITVSRPDGAGLAFQKVDEPTPGKNRVHIDFHAGRHGSGGQAAGRPRGNRDRSGQAGPDFQWVVLADPDGNAFCVAGGDVTDAS